MIVKFDLHLLVFAGAADVFVVVVGVVVVVVVIGVIINFSNRLETVCPSVLGEAS